MTALICKLLGSALLILALLSLSILCANLAFSAAQYVVDEWSKFWF